MSVNIEKAREFTAALRSGEFHQTQGTLVEWNTLRGEACYCAEGVLGTRVLGYTADPYNERLITGDGYRIGGFLSDKDIIDVFGEWVPIRVWNDSHNLSFSEIAERLEVMFPEIKG